MSLGNAGLKCDLSVLPVCNSGSILLQQNVVLSAFSEYPLTVSAVRRQEGQRRSSSVLLCLALGCARRDDGMFVDASAGDAKRRCGRGWTRRQYYESVSSCRRCLGVLRKHAEHTNAKGKARRHNRSRKLIQLSPPGRTRARSPSARTLPLFSAPLSRVRVLCPPAVLLLPATPTPCLSLLPTPFACSPPRPLARSPQSLPRPHRLAPLTMKSVLAVSAAAALFGTSSVIAASHGNSGRQGVHRRGAERIQRWTKRASPFARDSSRGGQSWHCRVRDERS